MKSVLFHSVFIALVSLTFSLDPEIQRIIDTVVTRTFIPYHNITGLGLAVVKDNGLTALMTKGYGYRDLENGFSVNADTIFGIGSISKSFTAILVVKTLHEKFPELGETALDTPIKILFPSFDFMLSDRFRSESTSLRDLLSHRTCLLPEGIGLTAGAFKNKAEFLYRQRYAEELCPFRTNFVYNNGALFIAGEIIAEMVNKTFESMLTDLFRQIGMNDTTYIRDSDDFDSIPNMSRAYYRANNQPKRFNPNLLKRVSVAIGSGGILSTSNDMTKYLMFHLNNGKVGSTQIVPEEYMNYLRKSSNPFPFIGGKKNPRDVIEGDIAYGLGVNVGLLDGWERVSHGGYLPPFESFMSIFPALNLAIFTASNGPGAINRDSGHRYLHRQIFDIIQKGLNYEEAINIRQMVSPQTHSYTSFPLPTSNFKVPKPKNIVQRMENEALVGVYGNGQSGEFTVSNPNGTVDGNLYLEYGAWGTGVLVRRTNTTFLIEWDSDMVQEFYASGSENVEVVFDFGQENMAVILFDDDSLAFEKDLTLDKLPSQPWDSSSCGPTL